MKSKSLIIFLLFFCFQYAKAQYFGVKGGINYSSETKVSVRSVKDDIVYKKAENRSGFHAGVWSKINLSVLNFYIRPELFYTRLTNTVKELEDHSISKNTIEYNLQKLDLPVLVGNQFFGFLNVYAGPAFQYVLGKEMKNIKEVNKDSFSVGLHFGGSLEFSGFGIDVRYERAFSDTEITYLDKLNNPFVVDTRINQIIIGLYIPL